MYMLCSKTWPIKAVEQGKVISEMIMVRGMNERKKMSYSKNY